MNERDSEEIAATLKIEGLFEVDKPDRADIVFINTCSVREKPAQKALSAIGRYIKSKRYKNRIIAVCGCYAKQDGERLKERFPEIDLVFGPQQIKELRILLKKVIEEKQTVIDVSDSGYSSKESFEESSQRISAFVNIMKGCNNFCSFCIVPYLRGREFSRRSLDIIDEIKKRVQSGVKEVILLGQNVNSYIDETNGMDFVRLLEIINDIDGLERIRFTTSHPKDVSDRLVDAFRYLDKLCSHIHLPVQSGSNRILSLMNRKYTREQYLDIVYKLRNAREDISITTDIIVGFPSESEADFKDTLSIIRMADYDTAYSFKYSPRPLTKAFREYEDDVPQEIKEERLAALQGLIEEIATRKNSRLLGSVMPVLIEGLSSRNPSQYSGRTSCNRVVNIERDSSDRDGDLIGRIVDVKIEMSLKHSLKGRIIRGDGYEKGRCCRDIAG